MQIRPATPADVDVICDFNTQLAVESEGRRPDPAVLRSGVKEALARRDLCLYFVAETEGQIVGQAMVTYEWSDWRNGIFWWFQSVFVHPEYRGRGVFRKLAEHIIQLSKTTPGVCGLRLYVEEHNQRAIEVYKRLGMTPSGHIVYELDWSGLPAIQADPAGKR
jgi:ribosomal protein S18 acetylase RimI-like enzyme